MTRNPHSDEDRASSSRRSGPLKERSTVLAAVITAAGGIVAALIGGYFLLRATYLEPPLGATATAAAASTGTFVSIAPTRTATTTPAPTVRPTETARPPTETPSPTPEPLLLFADSFDSGPDSQWQVLSGNWRMINGRFAVTGSQPMWSYALVGDPGWSDYVVEVDYSRSSSIGDVAVIVRADGPSGLGLSFGTLGWRVWQDGEWRSLVSMSGEPLSGHLRIEVTGATFVGAIDTMGEMVITDDTVAHGRVGLAIVCYFETGCPAFDNFRVSSVG